MKKFAKIFIIISMVTGFFSVIPFVLGLIVIKKMDKEMKTKEELVWSIITLILVSPYGGLILLVDHFTEGGRHEGVTKSKVTKTKEKPYVNLIETHNLVKKYGRHVVIDQVNMHIKEGEIYGFVGENGSGKTTIMRLISGLAEPSKGSYTLFGISSKSFKVNAARKDMSAIVEATSIVPTMNAMENMNYQALYQGIKMSKEEKQELLKKVHLEDVGKKKAKNFSLGMRQRLGIAMALMNKPKLLMLDEPMNGLDPQGIAELRELLIELHKKEGITVLISSHILSELEKIATTYGFISHGKLLEEITTKELHERCQKSLDIVVDKLKETEKLLKIEKIKEYKVLPNNLVKIYDAVTIGDIVTKLTKEKINILSINTTDETVEDYYLNLIASTSKESVQKEGGIK